MTSAYGRVDSTMIDLKLSHTVSSYECGADHLLKPDMFMQYCQEAAETHASSNQLGYDWSMSNGLIWVEVQGDFRFIRRPQWKEEIIMRSNTGKASPLQARRFVELLDKEGNILAQADLLWVLIDVNTRRPMPFKKIIDRVNIPDACPALIDTELRLAEEFTETATVEFYASRRDVDFNGHINNSAYLTWVLDTLPETMQPATAPARMRINFKKETFAGHPIAIEHKRAGNQTQHIITSNGELRATIVLEW